MAEEVKEEKKVTFGQKVKKALPWVLGGIGTIGAGILGFKFGKYNTEYQENLKNDNAINKYLSDRVRNLKEDEKVGVCVMDQNGKETYAELVLCDSKPDWIDNAKEITTESYFSELVTSVSTAKE